MEGKPTYDALAQRVRKLEKELLRFERWQEALVDGESRFGPRFEEAPFGYQSLDQRGCLIEVNQAWLDTLGYPREEVIGKSFANFLHPSWVDHFKQHFTRLRPAGEILEAEFRMARKDGSFITASLCGRIIRDEKGAFHRTHCILTDITNRKHLETQLRRINRGLTVRGQCNHVLVRANDESQLLKETCRILVRDGRYLLAWVGLREEDEDKTVRPVAQEGYEEGYLDTVDITWADTERGRGPTGTAIRTGKPVICKNIQTDPNYAPWRDEAVRRGYVSSIAVPLTGEGRALGALNIYSSEVDAFDKEEVDLLMQLGYDLGYGIAAMRDRAECMHFEEAHQESERKLSTLIANLPGLTYRCLNDQDWTMEFISEGCRELTGYPPTDLIHNRKISYNDLIHSDDRSPVLERIQEALSERRPFRLEYRIRTATGEEKWVLAHGVGLFADNGEILAMEGFVSDISDLKRALEALRESEEKFRLIAENSIDFIYLIDLEGNVVYASPALEQILGYRPEEVINSPLARYFPPSEYSKITDALPKMTSGKHAEMLVLQALDRNGAPVIFETNVNPVVKEGKIVGFQGIARDITKRKQAEHENVMLQEQLRQAQKMEAIGTLASGIAHDFNNLLTAILGNANLWLMEADRDDPLRENIEEIKKAGERAVLLTRQLLAFSRKQVIHPKVLNLNEVVTGVQKMIGRLIGENIELLTFLDESLWPVEVDPGHMEQVIINLIVNARDAMPRGGKITIETSNTAQDEVYLHSQGMEAPPGLCVMLAVTDTGVGIKEEDMSRIFEPFFTTKEKGRGTGLGLSTVYGIVKQNRGTIWAYSEPGRGTTFRVVLPRAGGPAAPAQDHKRQIKQISGSETVLVAEDDDSLRHLAQRILKVFGYRVLTAGNGDEALKVCREHEDPIHLILTDMVMPGIDGRELAERIRSLRPEIRVLYMSGYSDKTFMRNGALREKLSFIEKPFTPKALAGKVREVLDADPEPINES